MFVGSYLFKGNCEKKKSAGDTNLNQTCWISDALCSPRSPRRHVFLQLLNISQRRSRRPRPDSGVNYSCLLFFNHSWTSGPRASLYRELLRLLHIAFFYPLRSFVLTAGETEELNSRLCRSHVRLSFIRPLDTFPACWPVLSSLTAPQWNIQYKANSFFKLVHCECWIMFSVLKAVCLSYRLLVYS